MAEAILTKLASKRMHFPHHKLAFKTFSSGEVLPILPETIRRQHVFFLHPLQHPSPNEALMMMLLSCDAMMRASAAGVSLVTPFMSYQRQDRKDKPRRPISATLVANMIKATGIVERIITMEMHTDQQQGFYNIPVDNLPYARYFAEHIKARFKNDLGDFVVISQQIGDLVGLGEEAVVSLLRLRFCA
jgi:ribose-phosphate pyrophosphokinase